MTPGGAEGGYASCLSQPTTRFLGRCLHMMQFLIGRHDQERPRETRRDPEEPGGDASVNCTPQSIAALTRVFRVQSHTRMESKIQARGGH